MRVVLFAVALCLLPVSFCTATELLSDACQEFSSYDRNGDGIVEIESLTPVAHAGDSGPLVLMLAEGRVLDPLEGAIDLSAGLTQWAEDLAREGNTVAVVRVELGKSDLHQDGQYVLALRQFLRKVSEESTLQGVVLVGHFPDAMIVRTVNWRRRGSLTLHKKTSKQKTYKKVRYVRRAPELVAHKADIVLSDLDGNWESIYVQPKTKLPTTVAVFGDRVPKYGGPCLDVQTGSRAYEDFFHVSDGKLELAYQVNADDSPAKPYVTLYDKAGDHECSAADREQKNVLSKPDILVSRIDARGTALSPRSNVSGVGGAKLLDATGLPQAVEFDSKEDVPHWFTGVWQPDPVLERELLADFFERNHKFRTGKSTVAWRPSSIACELRSGYRSMDSASKQWEDEDRAAADVRGRPTLAHFVKWMQYPAILRTVRAHSNPVSSRFRKMSGADLDKTLEGPAWSWTQRGNRLEPSLTAACGKGTLNFFLLRSLWENNQVAPEPAFYHHIGCEGISPQGAGRWAYDHRGYGQRQGAEALMFYGNGLALVGRSKVFYDEPRGFASLLGRGATFGEAWAGYFTAEARSVRGGDISRKKAYFWSVLGDWTLKLTMAAPEA